MSEVDAIEALRRDVKALVVKLGINNALGVASLVVIAAELHQDARLPPSSFATAAEAAMATIVVSRVARRAFEDAKKRGRP